MPGTYKQQISASKNLPGCLVLLLDQSGSMSEQFGADKRSKAVAAARAVNTALEELVDQCTSGESVRNYFHVGVIGYGAKAAQELLGGGSGPAGLLTTSELESKAQIEEIEKDEDDGTGKLKIEKRSKWFDPVYSGGTPMDEALKLATEKLQKWVATYPNSFPPIVLNITDGEPNEPKPAELAAQGLRQVCTNDGDTLLFNCHISASGLAAIKYPTSDQALPDEQSKWLFSISSDIPDSMLKKAQDAKLEVVPGSRGFVYNAAGGQLIKFLRIGTVVSASSFDQ
ncbi:MAG TPA: vWA domain-containing protein [Verrucomicrobiae bacterium]|jgi:uncharacterized protein YegL